MPRSPSQGLRLALDLTELGARLREQRFRRDHPGCGEALVREFMAGWWLDRPGAPDGDAVGRPVALSKFRV